MIFLGGKRMKWKYYTFYSAHYIFYFIWSYWRNRPINFLRYYRENKHDVIGLYTSLTDNSIKANISFKGRRNRNENEKLV